MCLCTNIDYKSTCNLEKMNFVKNTYDKYSVQFISQSRATLCDPMDCSTPGFPVHHQLLTLTRVHQVGVAIQPSHPLSSPFPPAFNLSQHWGLFQCVSS